MSSNLAELHIWIAENAAEVFEDCLREEVGAGFERRDQDTLAAPAAGEVELVAWMPEENAKRCIERVMVLGESLEKQGILSVLPRCRQDAALEQDWQKVVREQFTGTQIGRLVKVRPSWEPPPQGLEEGVSIELDPGLAFGTGLHPSTRLAIGAIERLYDQAQIPRSVVDAGCGSGILAIVATKLWPDAKVLALDVDPVAVQVCRDNMAQNQVGPRVYLEERDASQLQGKFDLLLANLSFEVLAPARDWIGRCLHVAGHAILSGLLASQAAEICQSYARDLKFEIEYTEELDGWRSVLMRLRA